VIIYLEPYIHPSPPSLPPSLPPLPSPPASSSAPPPASSTLLTSPTFPLASLKNTRRPSKSLRSRRGRSSEIPTTLSCFRSGRVPRLVCLACLIQVRLTPPSLPPSLAQFSLHLTRLPHLSPILPFPKLTHPPLPPSLQSSPWACTTRWRRRSPPSIYRRSFLFQN